jgi:outer membrane murein-binding lipoprotein Lpp
LRALAPEAAAALLVLAGCAGGGDAARRDSDALKAEVRSLRAANEELARRVDSLSGQVEALQARAARAPAPTPPRHEAEKQPVIPPDLAVVRVEPKPQAPRSARTPPPVPTTVAISEPDSDRIEALTRRGGRDLAAEADGELRRARGRAAPAERARALVDFAARYPRHPSADNALVEASAALAEAGREDRACDLAERAAAEYPAGDALSDALERLAWCESRRGARDAERKLLERVVTEFPRTPAAARAGTRLATISGPSGATPEAPGRSGP